MKKTLGILVLCLLLSGYAYSTSITEELSKLNDLYKGGLQREQFLPFITTIKKYSIQKELLINDDYRLQSKGEYKRIFFPINEKTLFKINQSFRELTRNKNKKEKIITTKERNFKIENYFSGIARIKFKERAILKFLFTLREKHQLQPTIIT